MLRILALTTAIATAMPAQAQEPGAAKAFSFVALGDMPYKLPEDYARFERLIDAVNATGPAFTMHVGDIKSGSTLCSDEQFQKVKDQFALFEGALVYTPGDNEWTDCHREKAGRFDPIERLQKIRTMFFAGRESHGRKPVMLERQSDLMPDHSAYVENTRFQANGVMVATVHVVGSNNNFEVRDEKAANEYFERDAANSAWIKDTFRAAGQAGAAAVILAMQANMYEQAGPDGNLDSRSGFLNTVTALTEAAAAFGKPVLVTYGDSHVLDIRRLAGPDGKPLKNVFGLQVPGEDLIEAVEVTVDPASPAVFGFRLIAVRENSTI